MSTEPHSATILVVDDNPVNLQLLFEFLGNEGFRVLVCEDGEVAVHQARETLPDLILMDVLLPRMSGYDSCRAIHAQPETANTPVIFLTALSRISDKIDGFNAGGVDYLTKPLQFEEVLARVTTHLALRRMSTKLEQTNKELDRLNRRRKLLFNILGHDLQSPVATAVSAVRLLQEVSDESTRMEILNDLEPRVNRMNLQIRELLTWGEIQKGDARFRLSDFDLSELLHEIAEEVEEASRVKGLALSVEVGVSDLVRQDRTAVRTIVSNLVTNAIKFTARGGSVTLRGEYNATSVRILVIDTGTGMSPEQLASLFEGGHKPSIGTDGERGSGFGLLLSAEIAELIGVSISAQSTPGVGTTFTLLFPRS